MRILCLPIVLLSIVLVVGSAQAADEPLHAGRPLSAWLADLDDADVLVREEALEVLAQAGPTARTAAPKVEKLLADPRRSVRIRAALALWRTTGQADAAVKSLADSLTDKSRATRLQALQVLMELGPKAVEAVPAIVEQIDDADYAVSNQAQSVLQRIDRAALPGIIKALSDEDVRRRRGAARALMASIYRAEARPVLRRRLEDDDLRVRVWCAHSLWLMGQTGGLVPTVLAQAVREGDPALRSQAVDVVFMVAPRPRTALPILKAAVKTDDARLRVRAATGLWEIEHQVADVLPLFIEGLKNSDLNVWWPAARGVAAIGPEAKEAIPDLIPHLRTPGGAGVNDVADALVRIGPASIGPMVELLRTSSKDGQLSQCAAAVLSRLGPAAVEPVLPLLDHSDLVVRQAACRVIGSLGSGGAPAVSRLTAMLEDKVLNARLSAAQTLGQIGPAAREAVPALVKAASNGAPSSRSSALQALGQIDPGPKVLPVARKALEDSNVAVRVNGLLLLWQADPKDPNILPQLIKLLEQPGVPGELYLLLGRMGPAAAGATDALKGLLEGPDVNRRRQAALALGHIGPPARAAANALAQRVNDPDLGTRQNVLTALRSVGGADPKILVPRLLDVLQKDQSVNRNLALDLLGQQGTAAADAVPWLVAELKRPQQTQAHLKLAETLGRIDRERAKKEAVPLLRQLAEDLNLRVPATAALWRIDPDDRQPLTVLVETLERTAGYAQQLAAEALGTFGDAARPAIPALRNVLNSTDPSVRVNAARSLWQITGDTNTTLPVLIDALRKQQGYFRTRAADKLGEMGSAARSAVPALLEKRHDPDLGVRAAVIRAVQKIDPEAAAREGLR
jgi:HEAT repeat protein